MVMYPIDVDTFHLKPVKKKKKLMVAQEENSDFRRFEPAGAKKLGVILGGP